jgi:hypothetical protein
VCVWPLTLFFTSLSILQNESDLPIRVPLHRAPATTTQNETVGALREMCPTSDNDPTHDFTFLFWSKGPGLRFTLCAWLGARGRSYALTPETDAAESLEIAAPTLPVPSRIALSYPIAPEDESLPAVVIAYGEGECPVSAEFLLRTSCAYLDFDVRKPGELAVVMAFDEPEEGGDDELRTMKVRGPDEELYMFMTTIGQIDRFLLVVTTHEFQYRAVVNCATSEVVESVCESRYLN